MKLQRILVLFLVLTLTLGLFGCAARSHQSETTDPVTEPTEKLEDKQMQHILIIGNSHTIDSMQLLYEVFSAHQPDKQFVFGYLYYDGCAVTKHVEFYEGKQEVYLYGCNTDGNWERKKPVRMEVALSDQPWDIVFIQPNRTDILDETSALEARRKLEAAIDTYVKNPHIIGYHQTWTSPDDPQLWSDDWHVRKPPTGYLDKINNSIGTDINTRYTNFNQLHQRILTTDDTYKKHVITGAGVMSAVLALDVPQVDIFRDYTHLNDFGRLLAAYSFYAQYMGEEITEVKVTTVSQKLRYDYYKPFGDLEITPEMQKIIMDAANMGLADPYGVPGK